MNKFKTGRAFLGVAVVLLLSAVACVRTITPSTPPPDEKGIATDQAAETKDAAVQLTLGALLGTATNEMTMVVPSVTPQATEESATETPEVEDTAEATATEASAATETEAATAKPTKKATKTITQCYESRYAYDISIPDGTRMDPKEGFEKTWQLQNVGTCDWVNGKYQLVFVSGKKMGGDSPTVITFTVPANGYADFSIDLTAPKTPGTYRGYWMLKSTDGDSIGWGPDADQSVWVEIVVK